MNGPNNNPAFRNGRNTVFYGALAFLGLVFAFALGLILGAVFSAVLLPVIAALIAFAAAVLVSIIAVLIFRRRRGR